jgi:rRNA maturation endonuclease Nob1
MRVGTFYCNGCKLKFQLIGISTVKNPKYCPFCGKNTIENDNIIFG